MLQKVFATIFISLVLFVSVFLGLQMHRSKEHTLEHNGIIRRYRVHLPKGYSQENKYPLVVALHGYFFDGRVLEIQSGLSRKADQEGFIVVYPSSAQKEFFTSNSWNAFFCCGTAYEDKVDDAGFILKVVEKLKAEEPVDPDKVFLVGNSNGGMLANYIALRNPGTFKSIATVSGAIGGKYLPEDEDEELDYTYLEKSYQPVSILMMHGRYDNIVPFDGGKNKKRPIEFTGAYDNLNFWLENNECSKHPSEVSNQNNFTKETYTDCKDGTSVVFYATNTGHFWPGGVRDLVNVLTSRSVNATDIIWDFFSH